MDYGQFYFKKTTNGNLHGEFSNDGDGDIRTESADLLIAIKDSEIADPNNFIGEYYSTWREGDTSTGAKLKISRRKMQLFNLTWTDDNGKIKFRGEGMLCDNILIGNYRAGDK